MRSYAVVPPILLDVRQRRVRYLNRNSLVEDLSSDYKERQMHNLWTDQEKELFREKYLQHAKNFSIIASYLERKVRERVLSLNSSMELAVCLQVVLLSSSTFVCPCFLVICLCGTV